MNSEMSIKRNILLNPGPATTTDSVKYAMVVPDICPREREFTKVVELISQNLVKIAHGMDHYISVLFSGSGTAAVEACISSVVPEGKTVLIISNGAYGDRMIDIANSYNIEVIKYELPYGTYPEIAEIEKLLLKNRETVSHICVVHHETTTGMLNPIEQILKLARKFEVEIIIDAVSSYAGIPIDLSQIDYDYIISASNKNLQGMTGISFVIFKKELVDKINKIRKRSYYLNLSQQHDFFSKKNQMQFTPPVQVLYALQQAIKEYFIEGENNRYGRYCQNWQILVSGLEKIGFRLLVPKEYQSKLLTAILEPRDMNYNFSEMHDFFYTKGFTIYPGKCGSQNTFRIANIGEIYWNDIEQFLSNMNTYIDRFKITEF
jgi:2-aminoethylphosphonate-pyruvate transaminase